LDTTGSPAVIAGAVEVLAPRGTCGLVGAAGNRQLTLPLSELTFGRRLMGIIEGDSVPKLFIPALLALHRKGQLPFDRLVRTYPFEDINRAVADSESGRTVKAVLTFA
jgi:aryl-alcohol dehydrogenase